MDIKTFLLEIWDLIKKNKWILFGTSLVVTILSLAILLMLNFDSDENNENVEAQNVPVEFEVYIEEEYGEVFSNSYLLEILFTQPEVIDQVESTVQVDITTVLEEYAEENEPIYTSDDPINIERNTSSNLMEVTVDVGTETENMEIANEYIAWLEENDVEFFNDKQIYIISDPEVVAVEEVASVGNNLSIRTMALQTIISLIFGLFLGFLITVLKTLFSDTIQYGFTYGWAPEEIYIKESTNEKHEKIAHDLLSSDLASLVILSEEKLEEPLIKKLKQLQSNKFILANEISEISIDKKVDEFVFLIERGKTSKDWYHSQRRTLKLYPNARVKIIEK